MIKIRRFFTILLIICVCCINYYFIKTSIDLINQAQIQFDVRFQKKTQVQLFYGINSWEEDKSIRKDVEASENFISINFPVYKNFTGVRFDIGNENQIVEIKNIFITSGRKQYCISISDIIENFDKYGTNQIDKYSFDKDILSLTSNGNDPYFVFELPDQLIEKLPNYDVTQTKNSFLIVINILICAILDIFAILFVVKSKKVFNCFNELYVNRLLILRLSINDFKTKYAGSYFGIFWAFVQPIVTVVIFWFVFQIAFKSGSVNGYPFVLWLITGFVPWFFFSDAWNGGTISFLDYSYLVKKVVFKISILPLVKVCSALFVHLFFIVFMLIIYCCCSYFPTAYAIQVIYYSFALLMYSLALSYITSSLIIFFKDLGQIVNIILQIVNWVTPIMWNLDTMQVPLCVKTILMANPMYYIVNGYRDSMINHVWFWQHGYLTIYFWGITIILFLIGIWLFNSLRIHFADVL